jgi:hypothetical protein
MRTCFPRGAGDDGRGRPVAGRILAVTGQAEAGQDDTYRRIGEPVIAMLGRSLLVRTFVP